MNQDYIQKTSHLTEREIGEIFPQTPDFGSVLTEIFKFLFGTKDFIAKLDFLGKQEEFRFKYEPRSSMFKLEISKEDIDLDELANKIKGIVEK